MTQLPLLLVAACALIDPDGRVLIAQRPPGKSMAGLWEFPGGKVEKGERPEDTIIRELREELDIVVREACLAPFVFASHSYEAFHLLMPLYLCRRWEGTVAPQEAQAITAEATGLSDAVVKAAWPNVGRVPNARPDLASISDLAKLMQQDGLIKSVDVNRAVNMTFTK